MIHDASLRVFRRHYYLVVCCCPLLAFQDWHEVRSGYKGTSRIMRQWASSPLGSRRVSELDNFMAKLKKDRMLLDQVEGVIKRL